LYMLSIIRKILFAIFAFFMTTACVWLFPVVAQHPTTFAEMVQDKEKTLEKYRDIWNDTTIREVNIAAPDYELGEHIGSVTIPRMEIYEMPIYYGADDINNNWQITAPGHFGNWGIFGEKAVTALGGHNYQLFYDLPKMQVGDKFIVETDFDIFIYEVTGSAIYESGKHDWSDLTFNGKEPYSVDLLTCYPIQKVVTNDMYIVYTKMVKGTKFLVEKPPLPEDEVDSPTKIWQ
ncbi:MAG: sortase, partial [Eubacteriales bacterium]|nr:sortase [Eubacteriales bacterium]